MLERSNSDLTGTTLARENLLGRRLLFTTLVIGTMAAMIWLMAFALSAGGFNLVDFVLTVLFAATLPWTVVGFWNAAFGLAIMRLTPDPTAAVLPVAGRVRGDEAITASTALLLCIRNEGPDRLIRNVEPILDGLVAAGAGERFHLYVLSDTNNPDVAATEDRVFGALTERWKGRLAVTYRRRTDNTGFKAGNVRDFCERWGGDHDFAITLDADSFMLADAILRMVRMMQADARIGILQGLVVGMPTTSAFARLFQFGMRLGMRSFTLGSAWWQGDCGPYWGHNAILRLRPFIDHCQITPDTVGLGAHILSHDQIEAVLMRRAGYDVRVLPDEMGWEENPPTLIEFIRRDLRWCEGNMQYWPLLVMPGLKLISRYQLGMAIAMFVGSPAWIGLLVIGTLALAFTGSLSDFVRPDAGIALAILIPVLWHATRLATAIDVMMSASARAAYGGTWRFLANCVIEIIFMTLLSPIMWAGHTLFMIGLLLGRGIGWGGQARDDHAVPVALATRNLWPHALLGLVCIVVLAATIPAAIPYALYIAAGLILAIPLAVLTALPSVGLAFARVGIGRLPEEIRPPPPLRRLSLPAVVAATPQSA